MITRLAAALVGLGVLIPAIVYGGELAVELVVPVAMVLCLAEYAAMAFPADRYVAFGWLVGGSAATYGAALYAPNFASWAASAVVLATLAFVTLRPGEDLARASDRAGRLVLGVGWVQFLAFLPMLRRLDHGLAWLFLVLAISWLGDTGGYFAGRFFGRTKLYPRISPKKTWEGVAGGITLSVVGVLVIRSVALAELGVAESVALGALGCAAGIIGDLAESMLKRSFDVKDSGWIMPGHGGLLDRIDSVLFVGPLVYAFALWGHA